MDDLNRRFHYLRDTFRDNWTEPSTEPRYFLDELRRIYMDRLKLYRERFRKIAEDLESYALDTGHTPELQALWAQMAEHAREGSQVGVVVDTEGRPF